MHSLVLFIFVCCGVCVVSSMSVIHFKTDKVVDNSDTNKNTLISHQDVPKETSENVELDNELIKKRSNVISSNNQNCGKECVPEEEISEDSRGLEEARKRKNKKQQDLMSRILPMMIIPFMIQTAMIPMALTALKFMLLKSAIIGKLAILLGLLNAFRQRQNNGGVYSHNVNIGEDTKKLHQEHYGYYGAPEYGAWINR